MDAALTIVVAVVASFGSVFALLKFFGRSLIQHEFTKSLRAYDAHLTEKTEALKTQLSIYAHEESIALTRIDAQRAQAIQRLYSSIRSWIKPVTKLIAGSPHRNAGPNRDLDFYSTNAEKAYLAAKNSSSDLADHAIYFDADLYERLSQIVQRSATCTATFLQPIRKGIAEYASTEALLMDIDSQRGTLRAALEQELMPSIQEITEEFRKLLRTIR